MRHIALTPFNIKYFSDWKIWPPAAWHRAPLYIIYRALSKGRKIFSSKSFSQSANKPFLIKVRFQVFSQKGKKQCKQSKQEIVYARMA